MAVTVKAKSKVPVSAWYLAMCMEAPELAIVIESTTFDDIVNNLLYEET